MRGIRMDILIEAKMICKKYNPNSKYMELAPTSLNIEKGKIYVITGKSGSGKTTLLNILGGIDTPTTGHVNINHKSFFDLSDTEQSKIRNQQFGFVFQTFNLIPELTVFENIQLPKHFNHNLKINYSDIEELSKRLGIDLLLHKKPFQLSAGEQQRVAIARALIVNPDIIFADEPTGNLDSENSKNIADLLVTSVVKRNTTLVIVTHEECLIHHEHIKLYMSNGTLRMEE